MGETQFATPIIYTLFNRPETTVVTFARVAEVKPRHLFLIADGPRPNRPGEVARCALARKIVKGIDWDCEVHHHYADVNWGPRRWLSSGISRAFELYEQAIILEDDVLAEPSFFRFAEEMLVRYQDDPRVMHITGYCPVLPMRQPRNYPYSYYFSRFAANWGWATWRRAWQPYYDVDMQQWTPLLQAEFAKNSDMHPTRWEAFNSIGRGKNTWDYQWSFARLMQSGLSVVSAKNCIRNIGFGALATNTRQAYTRHSYMPVAAQEFPLRHPPYLMPWPSYERAARLAIYGRYWRNRFVQKGPRWLVNWGLRVVRWLEQQRLRLAV